MMKKLLLLSTVLLTLTASVKAQTYTATVVDTLHYYFNKYYFKTGITTYSSYPYYKDPAPYCKNAVVTHIGSRFENGVNDLVINGLEAFVSMPLVTGKTTIPVHMYLCSLNSSGMPVLPAIDSVVTTLTGAYKFGPGILGGNFKNPVTVSGDFAVLLRNMSDFCGDTVNVLRTAGLTNTYVATPIGWTSARKYADGNYGYVRYQGTFYNTKDFNQTAGYGIGTDYEFMVAPRVSYTVQASQQIPQAILDFNDNTTTDTLCTRTPYTYTNTSSWQFTNRFYNLIEFYRKWNLYYPFSTSGAVPVGGWPADSAITWNFEYDEQFPGRDPRKFLPYRYPNTNPTTVSSVCDIVGETCWLNQFRANLRPMSAFGRQPGIAFNIPFKTCFSYCGKDGTGIDENSVMASVKMYPNPSIGGLTHISGLKGSNTVKIYDVLGQEVSVTSTSSNELDLNLSQLAAGSYLVKIENAENQTKTIHMVVGQ